MRRWRVRRRKRRKDASTRWSALTPDVFAVIEPVLKAFCENIFHVGGPGSGHKTKLVYNFLTMGQAALISEALVAAAKSGLDLDAFCKVVSAGGANSGIFQMIAPSALAGTYDGLKFGLDLARKDLRYYTHLTEHLGLPGISARPFIRVSCSRRRWDTADNSSDRWWRRRRKSPARRSLAVNAVTSIGKARRMSGRPEQREGMPCRN